MNKKDKLYVDLLMRVTKAIEDNLPPQDIIGSLECLKLSLSSALIESNDNLTWERMKFMKKLAEENGGKK